MTVRNARYWEIDPPSQRLPWQTNHSRHHIISFISDFEFMPRERRNREKNAYNH